MPESRKTAIGVWMEWESEFASTGVEGLWRVVTFLVEGAARRDDVIFRLVTTPANFHLARALLAGLSAREGEHWTVHTFPPPKERAVAEAVPPPALASRSLPSTRHLNQVRIFLVSVRIMTIVAATIKIFLRPIWRFLWRNGLNEYPIRLRLLKEAWADPMTAAPPIGHALRRLPFGLSRIGAALENWGSRKAAHGFSDFAAASAEADGGPGDLADPYPEIDSELDDVADSPVKVDSRLGDFANAHLNVDGWLLLTPSVTSATGLRAPKFVLFADALPLDFPASYPAADWTEGAAWTEWYRAARRTLAQADGVITLSRHVATRHVARLFGVDPARIKPIPLAAPDRRGDLPFLPPDRRRTSESRRQAAEILRKHAVRRNWSYLVGFPFDEIDYVAISTPDRASKNISIAIEAVRRLIRRDHQNIKIFMTAALDENSPHCRVPHSLRESRLHLDAASLPQLPNSEHAAFYHCAAVTVHPSLFESEDTVLPFGESVGLGTPCLFAFGPHTAELLESYPELSPWVFDPYDADGLACLIRETVADRERILDRQMASYERMCARSWSDVAGEYADAIAGSARLV